MVVHCNWLFLQGHKCFPTFLLPLQLSMGTRNGKVRASLEKTFPFQNSDWEERGQIRKSIQITNVGEGKMHMHGKSSGSGGFKHPK